MILALAMAAACGVSAIPAPASDTSPAAAAYRTALKAAAQKQCRNAFSSFSRSAQAGFAPAQNAIGEMFESGSAGQVDYKRAVASYLQAARAQNPRALYNIGRLLIDGKIPPGSVSLFGADAVAGSGKNKEQTRDDVWSDTAKMHSAGSERYELAAQLWQRSADQGDALAQFKLGGLYENGLGVPRDLDRARALYAAAAKTLPEAQQALDALH